MSVWKNALLFLMCVGWFSGHCSPAWAGDFYRQILKERSYSGNVNRQWQSSRQPQGGYGKSRGYVGFGTESMQRGWSAPFYGSQNRRSGGKMREYGMQRQPDYMGDLQRRYDKMVQKNSETFFGPSRRSYSGFR